MNRFILYLFGFLLLAQANALACNFKIINFGDSIKKLDVVSVFPSLPDKFKGQEIITPLDLICENNLKLNGSNLAFFFVEDKLVQIRIIRVNMGDKNLMNFASEKYGPIRIPENIKVEDWTGVHSWKNVNEYINYISHIEKNENFLDKIEVLQLVSKKYEDIFIKYNLNKEEWLESQN
jgi:hypothetical protein